ncbi:MAG: hypothetical protein ACRC78_00490, partial [Planktothrix sp.]
MAICNPLCNILPAQLRNKCEVSIRKGGISGLVFKECGVRFNDITDPAEWCKMVKLGLVVGTGRLTGSKAKSSPTKKRTQSCSPETTIGETFNITFMSYEADNENFEDFKYWNRIKEFANRFDFGYITCDGLFYGFYPFGIDVDNVIEDSSDGTSHWEGNITWQGTKTPRPTSIRNLEQLLAGNCEDVVNFNLCDIVPSISLIADNSQACI